MQQQMQQPWCKTSKTPMHSTWACPLPSEICLRTPSHHMRVFSPPPPLPLAHAAPPPHTGWPAGVPLQVWPPNAAAQARTAAADAAGACPQAANGANVCWGRGWYVLVTPRSSLLASLSCLTPQPTSLHTLCWCACYNGVSAATPMQSNRSSHTLTCTLSLTLSNSLILTHRLCHCTASTLACGTLS